MDPLHTSPLIQPGLLNNTPAVLVGATGGIGAACAHALAVCGARIVLAGHSPARLRTLERELTEGGVPPSRLHPLSIDLRLETSCEALRAHALNALEEPPQLLINTAGIGRLGSFHEGSEVDLLEQVEVNLIGTIRLLRAFAEPLRQSKGLMVQVISGLAHVPGRKAAVYAATQHALKGLVGSLRQEYGGQGVCYATVTAAGAGVDTRFWDRAEPRTPRGAMLHPQRVAEAIMTVVLAPKGSVLDDVRVRTP
ncbi:MAG: SDR family oxidoreductase [Myxococcota bacterium]